MTQRTGRIGWIGTVLEVKIDVLCAIARLGQPWHTGKSVVLLMDGCNAGQRLGRSLALPGRGECVSRGLLLLVVNDQTQEKQISFEGR